MNTYCEICGQPTLKRHYRKCLTCWKSEQKDDDSTSITIQLLTAQVKHLEAALDAARNQHTGISPGFKRKLKQLCHPDKHGGSRLATEVFIALEKL